jgi:hypothetical protein
MCHGTTILPSFTADNTIGMTKPRKNIGRISTLARRKRAHRVNKSNQIGPAGRKQAHRIKSNQVDPIDANAAKYTRCAAPPELNTRGDRQLAITTLSSCNIILTTEVEDQSSVLVTETVAGYRDKRYCVFYPEMVTHLKKAATRGIPIVCSLWLAECVLEGKLVDTTPFLIEGCINEEDGEVLELHRHADGSHGAGIGPGSGSGSG